MKCKIQFLNDDGSKQSESPVFDVVKAEFDPSDTHSVSCVDGWVHIFQKPGVVTGVLELRRYVSGDDDGED